MRSECLGQLNSEISAIAHDPLIDVKMRSISNRPLESMGDSGQVHATFDSRQVVMKIRQNSLGVFLVVVAVVLKRERRWPMQTLSKTEGEQKD